MRNDLLENIEAQTASAQGTWRRTGLTSVVVGRDEEGVPVAVAELVALLPVAEFVVPVAVHL